VKELNYQGEIILLLTVSLFFILGYAISVLPFQGKLNYGRKTLLMRLNVLCHCGLDPQSTPEKVF